MIKELKTGQLGSTLFSTTEDVDLSTKISFLDILFVFLLFCLLFRLRSKPATHIHLPAETTGHFRLRPLGVKGGIKRQDLTELAG